jgi:hypothetical protein
MKNPGSISIFSERSEVTMFFELSDPIPSLPSVKGNEGGFALEQNPFFVVLTYRGRTDFDGGFSKD